jgi:hypothetical protein
MLCSMRASFLATALALFFGCGETLSQNPDPNVPTLGQDAAPSPRDAAAKDTAPPSLMDGSVADDCKADGGARATLAKDLVGGVWYIKEGAAGSWFRMNMTEANPQGSVTYSPITDPGYFACKRGTGLGTINNAAGEAILQLPDGCGNESRTYRFLCIGPANQGGYAELAAIAIETRMNGAQRRMRLVRYPTTYCAPDLSSCSMPD